MEELLWSIIWEQTDYILRLESVVEDLRDGMQNAKDMLDEGAFAVDERLQKNGGRSLC